MLIPDRENRLLESAALDLGEEGRKLFFRCQRRLPEWFYGAREVAVSLMLTNRTSGRASRCLPCSPAATTRGEL
jgi:hypothetical protein